MWQYQSGFAEMFIEFCARHSLTDYRGSLLEILTLYENYLGHLKEESEEGFENIKCDEASEFDLGNTTSETVDTKEEATDVDETVSWMKESANVIESMSVTSSDSKNTPLPPVAEAVVPEAFPSVPLTDYHPISMPSLAPNPADLVAANLWGPGMPDSLLKAPGEPEEPNSTPELVPEGGRPSATCPVCGKVFRSTSYIKFHLRMHSGESQHECRVCRRRFPFRSNLVRHELAHTGTRSFVCPLCQRTFILKHHLTAHIRRHHSDRTFAEVDCRREAQPLHPPV